MHERLRKINAHRGKNASPRLDSCSMDLNESPLMMMMMMMMMMMIYFLLHVSGTHFMDWLRCPTRARIFQLLNTSFLLPAPSTLALAVRRAPWELS